MENERALKALEYLDSIGYLKGEDKAWFEKYLSQPEKWKLWIDYSEIQISYAWDTEDFEYAFNVELKDIGLAVLNYLGLRYELV